MARFALHPDLHLSGAMWDDYAALDKALADAENMTSSVQIMQDLWGRVDLMSARTVVVEAPSKLKLNCTFPKRPAVELVINRTRMK